MTDLAAPPPSKRARWGFLAVAFLLVAGAFALGALAPEPERKAAAGADATAVPVRAQAVEAKSIRRHIDLSGVLEPQRRVELFAEVGGRVTRLGAAELERVEADQVLVEMDPLLTEVAVERARAAVARAESQLTLADSERGRFESLATRDAASASRRDQAVSAQKVATANLREARANLAEARDQLAKKTIRAPFAGVLQDFPVEAGEFLRAGERVGELLDLATARVELGVTDREIVVLEADLPVTVRLEAYPEETFPGRVLRVGAAADTTSRKFPVEVELPNPAQRLLPGMVARVNLPLGEPQPLRALPRDAVLDQFGVRFVYVVAVEDDAWLARRRRVEVREIPFRPEDLELLSGVEDGERVAVEGLRELRDGIRVRLRNEPALAGVPKEGGS